LPSERAFSVVTARSTFRGWMHRSPEVTTTRAPKSQLILFVVPVEYAQRPRRTDCHERGRPLYPVSERQEVVNHIEGIGQLGNNTQHGGRVNVRVYLATRRTTNYCQHCNNWVSRRHANQLVAACNNNWTTLLHCVVISKVAIFFAAVAEFANFSNLNHCRKFLRFAANRHELDSLYMLTWQERAFIAFCSFTDKIKDSA